MDSSSKLLIVGPSGAGKSFVLDAIRSADPRPALTFDLDFVGYRKPGDDWSKWHINSDIFKVLSSNAMSSCSGIVVAGCDSDPKKLISAARREGFKVVCLLPKIDVLRARRTRRGDTKEKVYESAQSSESWKAIAKTEEIPLVEDVTVDNLEALFS